MLIHKYFEKSDPEFIRVPQTVDEVNEMVHEKLGRHPALMAALKSLENKRSSRNAYILVVGTTGSGKSSAVSFA
jgi:Tfp pilus assembly pilus retraction ATPase PilT